jgi:two-component system NarL family sensor kinase
MVDADIVQIYFILALAIVLMLMMSGTIVLVIVFSQKRVIKEQLIRQAMEFDFQQKMLKAELESQETERRRLAADLHDSIGGMLSTIRVGITTLARSLPDASHANETKHMLDDTITSVRRISRDLMPSTLEKFGLIHALKELCERFQLTSGVSVVFHETEQDLNLEKNHELMIFRIAQELLNNAIKHAQANLIQVNMWKDEQIFLSVEDDGIGFDAGAHKNDKQGGKGLGLFNMENRARLMSGEIMYDKNRTKGSKTILKIPK